MSATGMLRADSKIPASCSLEFEDTVLTRYTPFSSIKCVAHCCSCKRHQSSIGALLANVLSSVSAYS
eukprot:IDg15500t1